ncbi:MAG: type IV pilus twitching motility protein PilT, partial [Oscillospiraceae bacterium]
MELNDIIKYSVEKNASDIFIISGAPLSCKVSGRMHRIEEQPLTPEDTARYVRGIFELAHIPLPEETAIGRELDFSLSVPGMGRFRVNVYRQRGSFAAVMRYVPFELPDPKKLCIPEEVMRLADEKNGIVLVTGVAGAGKSTTLSSIINRINETRDGHIITIEDPIEFLHRHKRCLISQREINIDTETYLDALRAALRQSPDVIFLGEMRDYETISVAMTAAETGQLVLSTLHTLGAANTIDRII